jgi:hypothetical protein
MNKRHCLTKNKKAGRGYWSVMFMVSAGGIIVNHVVLACFMSVHDFL